MTRTLLRSFYAAFALAAAAASVGDTDPRDWDPPLSSASSSSLSTDVRHSRVRQDSSSSSEVGADERELLDVVLVASIDGKFHALNRASGHVLWSMSAPHASTPPAPELGPLVRTAHPEIDPDLHDGQEQYIIEPQSGDIYVLADPAGPLQRLPFSMSRLVDIAPHHSQEGGVERMFVGKKETSLLVIELETGRLLRTINADAACPWERPLDESRFREVDLDDLEDSESIPPSSTHIYIGRTDYHVSIHTSPSPGSSYKPPVQNLLYSVYGPNNEDLPTQATYTRTPDDNYIQSLPGGDVICVTTSNGQKPLRWHKKLPNSDPGVAIFDIVKPRRGGGNGPPIALLQPRPRLEEVLGALPLAEAARAGALPHLDRAFVDMTRSGSLYAMSPDRFPLVIFADAGRLYHSVDGADDRKLTLNELTERRAWRNMCMAEGARNMDPRCLVGPKTLGDPGSSQFGKLLGEVPPKSQKPLDRAPATADRPAAPSPPLTLDAILNSQPNASGDRHGHDLKHGHGRGRGHSELKALPPTTEQPSLPAPHRLLTIGAAPDGSIQSLNALVLVGLGFLLAVLWLRRPASFSMPHVGPPGMAKSSSYQAPPVDRAYVQENTHVQPEQSSEPGSPHRSDASIGARPMTPAALETKELPPLPPTPLIDTENQPITPSTPRVQLEVPGDGEDESENENDGSPHKRRRPRRRGKKKRAGTTAKEGSEDGGLPTDADKASASGSADERITGKMLIVPSTPTIKEVKTPSLVVSDEILGFGSHGTVVYKGSLQGRAVAVKRLLQDFVTLASREVGILQDSDDHPNVIRYYYQEAHGTFLYIALELCPASLADVVERPDAHQELVAAFDPKRALKQITAGLRHLHALKIVHRDIKPQNILISAAAKSASGRHAGHRMLISDFGLCRRLEIDQTSFLPTAHGNLAAGTVGWRAPEILCGEVNVDSSSFADDNASQSSRGSSSTVNGGNGSGPSAPRPKRLTKSVDIFALGCVFYYTLTNGSHPYGDRYERDTNIVKDKKSLDQLERFGEEGTEAVDLIDAMLNYEPSTRPDTQAIMLHPYFWDSNRRLTFLTDVSDRFEVMCRDPRDAMLVRLETGAPTVVGHDWHQRLDRVFLDNLGKFRKYEGKSVQDLMRALRNKRNHYQDLPDNVKRHVGSMPDGFLAYFTRRFPRLFLHVYGVVGDSLLRTESMFRTYYELQD